MNYSNSAAVFGKAAAHCSSVDEIVQLIQGSPAERQLHKQAAAYGMVLGASRAVGQTEFFEDTRAVLDHLVRAKAQIDIASWHDIEIAQTTAHILQAAQEFVDTTTIPCTDWARPAPEKSLMLCHKRPKSVLRPNNPSCS